MIQYAIIAYLFVAVVIMFVTTKDVKKVEYGVVENMSMSILYLLWLPILILVGIYYLYRAVKWLFIDTFTGKI